MTRKFKVLSLADVGSSLTGKYDKSEVEIVNYTLTTREKFEEDLKRDLKDIDAIYAHWLGFEPFGGLDRALIAQFPASLRIIAIASVGFNGFDLAALKERGIYLTNVPASQSMSGEDVADEALFLVLESFRRFSHFHKALKQTGNTDLARQLLQGASFEQGLIKYNRYDDFAFGHRVAYRRLESPRGKIAGIVGFGNIGRAIAHRLHAIGMEIHYYKPQPIQDAVDYKVVHHSDMESLLKIADVIVLSVPGHERNRHMFNSETISQISAKGLRLVNVSRGFVCDEHALVEGLANGKLHYVATDVFEFEPDLTKGFMVRDDVYCLPHIGSSTEDTFDASVGAAFAQITKCLHGSVPENNVTDAK